jgi:hypothetical protein
LDSGTFATLMEARIFAFINQQNKTEPAQSVTRRTLARVHVQ